MSRPERVEAAVEIDIVDEQHAPWLRRVPGMIELEKHVSLRMPAVVYEHVDPPELIQEG
jgi:hypothetical protein